MASPFTVFRKNQKVLLAIVAITAMVAFVFLDPLMKYVGRTTKVENPVVVETRYGELTHGQLEGLRASRELVDRFLRMATAQTVMAQLEKGLFDPRLRDQAMNQLYGFWHQTLMGRSKAGPEEAAVETLVLSKRAEQLGMVVSDRAINDLLKQITDNSLSSEALQAVIRELGGSRRVSVARLFDALRTEILASKMSDLFFQSLRDVPPAQRFEYYESLNRKAKVEIVPLAVASFVGQVSEEPTNEQLRTLYDEHKNRFPDPASPEPGFKQPKRASFQYFKADFTRFKEEFKPQVTEEEIAKYYEENKAQFRAVELPKDTEASKDAEKEPGQEPKPDEAPPEGKDEPKASDAPPTDKPAEPAADGEEKSLPPEKKEVPAAPQSAVGRATVRLVSQTTEAEKNPPEATGAEAAKSEPAAAAPEAPADAAAPAADQADDKPAAAQPAAATDAPAEKPAEEIKYEPLEKVKDTIRESLASQKAQARIVEIFDELQAAMRRYADDRDLYNARGDAKSKTPPPSFAFEELAKAKNVEGKTLDQVTAAEAATSDIGGVQRAVMRSQFDFRSEAFAQFAFADSLILYKPEAGQDAEGNGYLFWKTQEEAAFVPPLDKIRERVERAWKTIKARELARKRAGELAEQARAAQKPLAEVFAGQADLKVSESNSFSWLSTGNVPLDPTGSEPRISQVDGVEYPGDDFMKAVFDLSPGQVGVAFNHPRETVYVLRLIDYDRKLEELRDDFASEPPTRYMMAANQDRRNIYRAWLAELNEEAGVHWLRQADSTSARGPRPDTPLDDEEF